MKPLAFLSMAFLLAFGSTARAHAHLEKATPADGAVITRSPPNLVLNFSQPIRMTTVSIQKDTEAKRSLGPLPTTPSAQIRIAVPELTPGDYVVSWRAVSGDNHVMSGTIRFTLSPESAADHSAHSDHSAH